MSTERSNLTSISGLDRNLLKILGLVTGNDNDEEPPSATACKVCRDIADFSTFEIGKLFSNAQITKCSGCSFLGLLLYTIFGGSEGLDMGSSVVLFPQLGGGDFLLCISPPGLRPPMFSYSGLIEVYRKAGESFPWKKVKVATSISGDTGSAEAFGRIETWINDCQLQHINCRKNNEVELPTRVLDLEAFDNSKGIRLVVSNGARGRYASLSHRWIEGHTITTTRSNLLNRLECISWSELSLTYQEAIMVARHLKIKYLWIDSLCILQQDTDDWLAEAPKMATVYNHAYITLSASCAVEKKPGLFRTASEVVCGGAVDITSISGRYDPYVAYFRMPLEHRFQPLQSRGWVFQESLLSPRVVHFAENELVFECAEKTTCECGVAEPQINISDPNMNHFHDSGAFGRKVVHYNALRAGKSDSKLANHWRDMIHEYTRKHLTYESDIFPALAGLVKQMQKEKSCQYYAGLWEDTLAIDLLWAVRHVGSYEEDQAVEIGGIGRPSNWRAPTWSWASTTGPVTWGHLGYLWDGSTGSHSDCTVGIGISELQVTCVPETVDPTMRLSSGKMSLKGPLAKEGLKVNDKGELQIEVSGLPEDLPKEQMPTFRTYPDYDYKLEGKNQLLNTQLAWLLVGQVQYPSYKEDPGSYVLFSLILRCVDEAENIYERVGLIEHDIMFDDTEQTALTLI